MLGDHRLLCGDATVPADVERVLDGQLADMTFTDPPYNVDYGSSAKDKLRGNWRKILNDDLGGTFPEHRFRAAAVRASAERALAPGGRRLASVVQPQDWRGPEGNVILDKPIGVLS